MKSFTGKNSIKYFATALAISGTMLLGACGSEEAETNEVYAPETEVVSREVETEEYRETEVASTETMQENQAMTASSRRTSSVNIDRLLNEYPNVNQAIRTTLSAVETDQGGDVVYSENEIN